MNKLSVVVLGVVKIFLEAFASIIVCLIILGILVQCTFDNPSKDLCVYNAINNKYSPQQIRELCK